MKDKYIHISIILLFIFVFTGCIQTTHNHKYSALHKAVRLNQIQNVKLLINSSQINTLDSFKESPIVDSIRNNSTEISKLLICNGSDLNIIDSHNNTLIDLAINNNNSEILEFLKNQNSPSLCNPYKNIKNITNKSIKKDYITNDQEIKEINLVKKFDLANIDEDTNNDELINSLTLLKLANNDTFNKEELRFKFSNSGDLNDDFKNRLAKFNIQFIELLKKYNNKIESINIKNYTSSEYRSKKTVIGKFMANSKISQKRANKIKQILISNLNNKDLINKITPLGMSSQNTIKNSDGSENSLKSRRTEIEIVLK